MKKSFFTILILTIQIFSSDFLITQPDVKNTRMMNQPAISKNKIAFIYSNDLWIADINGSNPKRITIDNGIESNPVFSPDGNVIAFCASYDGNTDVYIVPSEGGIPKRLTWHPGADIVVGFTPDGKNILFNSGRNDFSNRLTQLFKVPAEGGNPEIIPLQSANKASYSPDGKKIAYTPLREVFRQWKNYRGGTVSTIWICNLSDLSIEKIPQPKGYCNDTDPMWVNDIIYFNSDRNGEFNLFSYNTTTKVIEQLTKYNEFPVLNSSYGDDNIIFEQAGYIYKYDLSKKNAEKITIGISADLINLRARYLKGSDYIRTYNISPSGARAVFEMRGEIFTVPAEKGDPRNITNSVSAHERFPIWSPDGKYIAYYSDESGEYQLNLIQGDGKGEVKKFKIDGAGFYENPVWSPDSKKISFKDNSSSLYYIDIISGKQKKVGTEILYNFFGSLKGNWSPDSKWLTYTLINQNWIQVVYLYNLDEDKSYRITDGLSDVSEPVFDKNGKYLYFLGSTDAGPVKQWFDLSNTESRLSNNIYLAVLDKDSLNPLAKETDEEKIIEKEDETDVKDKAKDEKKDEKKDSKKDEKKDSKKDDEKSKDIKTKIDIDGIQNRIVCLPVTSGFYFNLTAGKEGEIFFLSSPNNDNNDGPPTAGLHRFDLKTRKDETALSACSGFEISSDRAKLIYQNGTIFSIAATGAKIDATTGKLNLSQSEIYIDPKAEWKQIFEEVWRINRDYFYDPNYHGADWDKMKKKYEPFVKDISCRGDLNRIIQWLCSELSVGHSYSGGGDYFINRDFVPVGLLGADYEISDNRFRFKKIFAGLNWNPRLRAPLGEPGINVKTGDYLISVNGKEIFADDELYKEFEYKSGKIIDLTVSDDPDGKDSRTYQVVPVPNESGLRNIDWIEGNIKKVNDATDGQVAYVWVPNTSVQGYRYFKRWFFPQADKKAIILDERFNGGGLVADYYIDILKRPYIASNATRYGNDSKIPGASIQGPKVMLIDENAGSGGDLLPWMFKKFNMGQIIGKRTWGGLVGITGYPVLIDGGFVTSPNLGLWAESGWICENEGVAPDIEVDQIPSLVNKGRDPQLDKAIDVILDELKKNPPVEHKRPPYPVRVRK